VAEGAEACEATAADSPAGADLYTRRTLYLFSDLVLIDRQLTIRVEHIRESDDARSVGFFRAVAHALQFVDFTEDFIAGTFRLDEKAEGVFDIFGRVQDGATILEQGFGIGASSLRHF